VRSYVVDSVFLDTETVGVVGRVDEVCDVAADAVWRGVSVNGLGGNLGDKLVSKLFEEALGFGVG